MITFKQFIADAVLTSPEQHDIEVDDSIEFLEQHSPEVFKAIENNGVIFRGFGDVSMGSGNKWKIVDSSKMHRTSRDTNNVYQMLMDNSDALSHFPKRTNSFICTTNISHAEAYSSKSAYVVVPVGKNNLAVAAHRDVMLQELKLSDFSSSIDSFSTRIGLVLRFFGVDSETLGNSGSVWRDFDNAAKTLDLHSPELLILYIAVRLRGMFRVKSTSYDSMTKEDIYDELHTYHRVTDMPDSLRDQYEKMVKDGEIEITDTVLQSIYKKMLATGKDFLKIFATEIFTPDRLHLQLIPFGNTIEKTNDAQEVWFSGKAIIIPMKAFKEILNRMSHLEMAIHPRLIYQINSASIQ